MKQAMKILSAVILTAQIACVPTAGASPMFKDLATNHWAKVEIETLKSEGIIGGYEDGTFRPNNPLTRAEAVVMLAKAMNLDNYASSEGVTFVDVDKSYWACKAIEGALSHNILSGYPDGTFRPDNTLNRAETAKLLGNSYMINTSKKEKTFDDVNENHWAYTEIQSLASNGVTKGADDGAFGPEKKVTRAEFAAFLFRTIKSGAKPIVSISDSSPNQKPKHETPVKNPGSKTAANAATYNLDPARWGIYNDGTHPVETTDGFNQALEWANKQGHTVFKVPAGTYLIAKGANGDFDKRGRINLISDMTFWLDDNAVIQKETNSFAGYSTMYAGLGVKNVTIKGGTYRGDRETHDYAIGTTTWQPNHAYAVGDKVIPPTPGNYYYAAARAGVSGNIEPAWTWTKSSTDNTVVWQPHAKGTHEGGYGILTQGAFNVTIDGVKTEKFTGDGICIGGGGGYFQDLYETSFEPGGIDDDGKLTVDPTKIRIKGKSKLTDPTFQLTNTFSLDNGIGGVPNRVDFYFYKADGTFHSTLKNQVQGNPIAIPAGAELITATFSATSHKGWYLEIWNRVVSKNVVIQNSESAFNRRQGLTIGGVDNILVQNNVFHDSGGKGGTAPMAGIDVEGGTGNNGYINSNVNINNNEFYNNTRYDVILYDGHDAIVEGNHLGSKGAIGLAVSNPFTTATIKDNRFDGTSMYIAHDVNFIGNKMNDSLTSIEGPRVTIDGMTFTDSEFIISPKEAFGVSVSNVTMNNNKKGGISIWGNPVHLKNVTMYGGGLGGSANGNIIDNLKMIGFSLAGVNLSPGTYTDCKMESAAGTMPPAANGVGLNGNGSYVFNSCSFKFNGIGFQLANASTDLTIRNSNFDVRSKFYALKATKAKKVLFENNTINALGMTAATDYVFMLGDFWTKDKPHTVLEAVIRGNSITANLAGGGISTIYAGTGAPPYQIENNTLRGAKLNLKANDIYTEDQELPQ